MLHNRKSFVLFLVGALSIIVSFLVFLVKLVTGSYGEGADLSGAKLIYTGMFLVIILVVSFGFTAKE